MLLSYRNKLGFTLVEIMIVVAIIVMLVSIAIPTYARIRIDTKAKVCMANHKQIEAAVDQWSFEYDIPEGAELPSYKEEIYLKLLGGEPSCPTGGSYVLTNLGDEDQAVCSSGLEGHEYP